VIVEEAQQTPAERREDLTTATERSSITEPCSPQNVTVSAPLLSTPRSN